MTFSNPANHLYIPEPPMAFFYIRFEIVGGIVVFSIALYLFLQFGLKE